MKLKALCPQGLFFCLKKKGKRGFTIIIIFLYKRAVSKGYLCPISFASYQYHETFSGFLAETADSKLQSGSRLEGEEIESLSAGAGPAAERISGRAETFHLATRPL